MRTAECIFITGGAGFIGSHVVKLFVRKYPHYNIINLDSLTYAANLNNLNEISDKPNYKFEHVDIIDESRVSKLFDEYQPSGVIHLAAESHVDRSILDPIMFVKTNVLGTVNLLNAALKCWKGKFENKIFHHVSTDEVYGSLDKDGLFTETTHYDPQSPYSASKASSDHFVRAYGNTYGLPTLVTNCSNNYGPFQFPEKLVPLCINNIKNEKPIPVYGRGENIRDWLYVEDHALAIDKVFHEGTEGETYNIGGNNEWTNIALVTLLCKIMDDRLERPKGHSEKLIKFVEDRAGHDLRYAIDSSKINSELGWEPQLQFEEGLEKTVDWYLANIPWLDDVVSGKYQEYYSKQYSQR